MAYQDTQRLVDQGDFSEKMGYCGKQRFSFYGSQTRT